MVEGPSPVLAPSPVVSFAGHPLSPWAQYVGRWLQLVIFEIEGRGECLGFQNLRGVRDQINAFHRLGGGGSPDTYPREPMEMDMEDMFREIPKKEGE